MMRSLKSYKLMNPRAKQGEAYVPTYIEHTANIITHLSLIIPSLYAAVHLYYKAANMKEKIVVFIYCMAITSLFITSTTFHILAFNGKYQKLKQIFHVGDRAVIYIFIASSYTPWLILRHFHWKVGITFFWMTWAAALFGISYQYLFLEKHKTFETFLYIFIASFPTIAWFYMIDLTGTMEMILGGLFYAVGVIFFKCDGKIPFAHAIWHLFVLIGASIHYHAVNVHLIIDD